MWNRKLLLGAIVASAIASLTPSVNAATEIYITTPPPPVRYEVAPTPRAGYVWAPGYWNWRNNRHAWVKGHWERERSGYYYHPNRWVERDNGRWDNEHGRWDRTPRDRDGDGVPNRLDRAPDNPRRQ